MSYVEFMEIEGSVSETIKNDHNNAKKKFPVYLLSQSLVIISVAC